jgi:hypothetical protein
MSIFLTVSPPKAHRPDRESAPGSSNESPPMQPRRVPVPASPATGASAAASKPRFAEVLVLNSGEAPKEPKSKKKEDDEGYESSQPVKPVNASLRNARPKASQGRDAVPTPRRAFGEPDAPILIRTTEPSASAAAPLRVDDVTAADLPWDEYPDSEPIVLHQRSVLVKGVEKAVRPGAIVRPGWFAGSSALAAAGDASRSLSSSPSADLEAGAASTTATSPLTITVDAPDDPSPANEGRSPAGAPQLHAQSPGPVRRVQNPDEDFAQAPERLPLPQVGSPKPVGFTAPAFTFGGVPAAPALDSSTPVEVIGPPASDAPAAVLPVAAVVAAPPPAPIAAPAAVVRTAEKCNCCKSVIESITKCLSYFFRCKCL